MTQASIPRGFDALEAREQILRRAMETQSKYTEAIRSISHLRESFDKSLAPLRDLQRRYGEIMRTQDSYLEKIRESLSSMSTIAYIDPMKDIRVALDRHRNDVRRMSEVAELLKKSRWIAPELQPLSDINAWHKSVINRTQIQIAELLKRPAELEHLMQVAGHPDFLSASDNGVDRSTRVASREPTSADEVDVSTELRELSASIGETRTLQEFLAVLLRYAAKYGSIAGLFALLLFKEVLVSYAANQLPSVDTLLVTTGLTQREGAKEVRKNAQVELTDAQRETLRFVGAPSLDAHISPKQKSKVLARLSFGTPVVVNGKTGDWVFVVYRDPLSKEEVDGWMLARYVQKFDK
ncbi:SH3 domain-containing protein [Paraburkholderia hospita]|uniref:SH3 domain-containing protein n=1 Tax=Paraburkholderia hospita TaxID=169430 RepID=UPI000271B626|nr:SH3 domain-containing protein [Paraburkholderia hospita]EUC18839.1 hypothetical protein PMI06_003215 [Burkholderia sp. BT03]SKC60518.1 hypothetical protein SAMN06266956_1117 [Paraburkholderia hospita]